MPRLRWEKQRISNEALEATREACRQLIGETEQKLGVARVAEADRYLEKVLAETQQDAHRIREDSRSAALRECQELKRHVTYEVQSILAEVDAIRAAAQEELEAQRIYSETANLKSTTAEVRAQVLGNVNSTMEQGRGVYARPRLRWLRSHTML